MSLTCLICNTGSGTSTRNFISIFGQNSALQSQKKLETLLTEVLGETISEDTVTTNVICKKCFKACSEYDSIQVRQEVLKNELRVQYAKNTPTKDTITVDLPMSSTTPKKKIVLPASKLQPLPADFVFDSTKLAVSKNQLVLANKLKTAIPKSPTVNLKVTVGSSVLTQSIKTTSTTDPKNIVVTMLPTSIAGGLSGGLPRDFMMTGNNVKDEGVSDDVANDNDDHPMEIDEDCSLAMVPVSTDSNEKLVYVDNSKDKNQKSESNFIDLSLLLSEHADTGSQDGQTVKEEKFSLDNLEILNNEDGDDDEAIIMADENGATIIRIGSGTSQFLYGGTQYVVEDIQDNENSHDSNEEESQIELQVSGDEETANAIIAAAQEQGGAFIEVESGEMFRVESVQSKTDEGIEETVPLVKPEDGKFRCLLCDQNAKEGSTPFITDAESMMQHLKTAHDARLYICNCGKIMRKRSLYSAHIVEHMPKLMSEKTRFHECGVCGRRYTNKTLLREHIHTHTGDRAYSCSLCDKTFANKYTHQAHLKIHEVRQRPFKCDQCGKTFFTQQNLNQHEKTHSGIRDFICNVCNKAFATQHNLEVHGVIHSGKKPFSCQYCPKSFARRAELRDHTRIHTGERPFTCDICSATFTQRSNLHSHKRATHLDDKRYHCTQCPKRFKRRRLLDYHIKAAHTGERPLQCTLCPSTFVYPEHYKKHMRIHTGVKPYVCEVCGKSFNSRDNRNTHRFVHSEKKPYECLTCGAGYRRKQLLYTHMTDTGHVAESIVVNQPRVIKATDSGSTVDVQHILEGKSTKYNNSGHVVESLVVNQPRVIKASDSLYGSKDGLDLDSQEITTVAVSSSDKLCLTGTQTLVLQDGSTINMVSDGGENLLLHELNASLATAEGVQVSDVKIENPEMGQMIASDSNGELMRLIQIQLADGKSGWVAINKPIEETM